MKRLSGRWFVFFLVFLLLMGCVLPAAADTVQTDLESYNNRYKIVFVLDSSGSMVASDPKNLRNEAVNQFVYLLAEEGNAVGAVTFSHEAVKKMDITPLRTQNDKEKAVKSMIVEKPESVTNIGGGLEMAVDMLNSYHDKKLPSVIILLSDGNTEHPDKEVEKQYLEQKAEAIQKARENDITIHTVCLNYNNKADLSEMDQIAKATGGVFKDIRRADDLQEVFNAFYNLIYGTSTIELEEKTFPATGVLEQDFFVPSLGVEEINIIIYGEAKNPRMINPSRNNSNCLVYTSDTFTLLKQTEVEGGQWKLTAEGKPGSTIRINMVYNTDLGIDVGIYPEGNQINPSETLTITAKLRSGSDVADSEADYVGYNAFLNVMNAYYEPIGEPIPMAASGDSLVYSNQFDEGVYYFNVDIKSECLDTRTSEYIGPVVVDYTNNNTAPVALQDQVTATINLWPFVGGKYSVDLQTLATDAQDETLRYVIKDSSFMEGDDYTVVNDVLEVHHFSLSKGSFTVTATDTGGLSCEVEILLRTNNITLITVIILAVILLVVLFVMYRLIFCPHLRGAITINASCSAWGLYDGNTIRRGTGRIKLTSFGLSRIDKRLIYSKCYIQATGKNYVYLKTNIPVYCPEAGVKKQKKVRITSGRQYSIYLQENVFDPKLEVQFEYRKR